jgi:DNA polymerase (family 10)
MINQEVAQIFSNIADYLEMNNEKNVFRIRAFKKASEVVLKYPQDVGKLNLSELKKINGIGESTAKDILQYAETGKIDYYEQLKKESPVKLEELTKIQGMGPKRVKKLYYELGVKTVDDLKKAAESGKIAKLEGFGEKSQTSILENIEFAIVNKDRTRLDTALQVAQDYINYLKQNDIGIINVEYGGSLRRREETVGDIDILVSSKDSKNTSKVFTKYSHVEKVLGSGETKSSVWLKQKVQVDMRVIDKDSFGTALQYFTGNVDHNVLLRKIAIKKGLKLSEYGLFRGDKNLVAGKDEKETYKLLVNNYIIPELRTDNGELDLALKYKLPNPLKVKDITGDMHMHTTHSDGANTPDEMVKKCIDLGYTHMGFADHFGNLGVANAVRENEFNHYFEDLLQIKEKYSKQIKIFIGAEANIKPNGDLDFDQNKLQKLDFVVASIHSSFKQSVEQVTERYLKVLQNPAVKIIGHPTGRLIGERPGFEFDFEKVFNESAKSKVAMEINAHPMRLDLPYQLAIKAKQANCSFSINTDAHSIHDLDLMKYGVFVARKAGIEVKNLYNLSKNI